LWQKRKGKLGDKGKVINLRTERTGCFRKSFLPAPATVKSMKRTINTIPFFKEKLLPNLKLLPRHKSDLHTQKTVLEVPGA
jgi:hypothetical protein